MSKTNKSPSRLRHAAGCVVYRRTRDGAPLFLLIKDPYGRWALPKGHLEGDESDADAAVREVWEETGVRGELGEPLSKISYTYMHQGQLVEKRVSFFLMQATTTALTPQGSEGISEAGWFPLVRALAMINYDQVRDVLARAAAMLEDDPPVG
jgi:8-oxo-dGTP diphosphatase